MRLAVAVLSLMMLLSGCVVEKGPTAETDSVADEASGGAAGQTGGRASNATTGGNAPSASSLGSPPAIGNVSLNATGLNVTFTITGNDADNDTVTWVLDFGDNSSANGTLAKAVVVNETAAATATSLVANVTHAYAAAGLYNATLTLSDGTHQTLQTVNATVADAAPAFTPMAPLKFTGSCTTIASESVKHTFDVTPGQPLIHATIAIAGGGIDIDWYLLDPSGGEADAAESADVRIEGPLEVASPVAGTWTFEVVCYAGAAASYTINARFA